MRPLTALYFALVSLTTLLAPFTGANWVQKAVYDANGGASCVGLPTALQNYKTASCLLAVDNSDSFFICNDTHVSILNFVFFFCVFLLNFFL